MTSGRSPGPARTRAGSGGTTARGGVQAAAVGSRPGWTCQPIGPVPRIGRGAVEREGRGVDVRGESGEVEVAPGIDPRHGRRHGGRRAGVARAPEPGAGPGRPLKRGTPPRLLRRRPGSDQGIEMGRRGPRGGRIGRDVVRAAGPCGRREEPSAAGEHEARDQPTRRVASSALRPHADHLGGSRLIHSSARTGLAVDRRPTTDLRTRYSTLARGRSQVLHSGLWVPGCRGAEGCEDGGRVPGGAPMDPPGRGDDGPCIDSRGRFRWRASSASSSRCASAHHAGEGRTWILGATCRMHGSPAGRSSDPWKNGAILPRST